MKRFLRSKTARIVLPIVVILAGVGGFAFLVSTKPQLARNEPQERVWTVSAVKATVGSVQPQLRLYGQVVAGREVEMRSLVAGQVLEVGPNFKEGGVVRAGDLLVAIDPFDSQAALEERRAQLDEAKAATVEFEARRQAEVDSLKQDEEGLEVRRRDLARTRQLQAKGNSSEKALDLAQLELSRQSQIVASRRNMAKVETARLNQKRAAVRRLEVGVSRAERDLSHTRLTASVDGFLLDVTAQPGKRLAVNDRVARLFAADRLEVKFHLSDQQYGRLLGGGGSGIRGRAAKLVWQVGNQAITYDAKVERVSAQIDASTGGVDLYARILGLDIGESLRPGAFVEVSIADRVYDNVARVPESAVFDDTTLYVVVGDRLVSRRVEVVAREGGDLLVRGDLAAGEQIVTTRFAEVGPGVRVEVR